MTPGQQTALEALVGRALTLDEIAAIDPMLGPPRRDDQIAALLSAGRQPKAVPTEIGIGTILAVLRSVEDGGGKFLDALEAIGQTDRDVFWTMHLIKAGKLRIDLDPVREGMQSLALAVPSLATKIATLLTLGKVPDPIERSAVSAALNKVV